MTTWHDIPQPEPGQWLGQPATPTPQMHVSMYGGFRLEIGPGPTQWIATFSKMGEPEILFFQDYELRSTTLGGAKIEANAMARTAMALLQEHTTDALNKIPQSA